MRFKHIAVAAEVRGDAIPASAIMELAQLGAFLGQPFCLEVRGVWVVFTPGDQEGELLAAWKHARETHQSFAVTHRAPKETVD
jgi:hypothetical protein